MHYEDQPDSPPRPRCVEAVFIRQAPIIELWVAGQMVRTAAEPPFFVQGKGWTAAHELSPNDLLLSHDGNWLAVQKVEANETWHTVYNLRIEEDQTNFIGEQAWLWSVWMHNSYKMIFFQQQPRVKKIHFPL